MPSKAIINEKLKILDPSHLEIIDESALHASHIKRLPKNHQPEGDEDSKSTHLKIIISSNKFKGMNNIQKHRLINNILKSEFEKGLHALSIKIL